ncbi:alpha/beta fold hydrolase [Methylocystis sp. H4A]|uniref:alpha/beta fold hydrolase n=1 Tax=Methylocystis sp. H4A TaxID=2785788 RepID=UPI0018C1FEF3|nr:alpha/beta hydrolase [Methylocystis sp. H4A]MBG0801054.1 alpha/beta fold hydrolase [Methylocystis sp. H4A]
MSDVVIFALIGFVAMAAAIVLLSFLVEAMRPIPPTPERLSWAPDIPIRYVSINGVRLRYIKTGKGPVLVLLHTLRTQLDLFEKVVPELTKSFTVYAVDYPGHGYSDIPAAKYDADYFVGTIEGFLDALDLHDLTLAGVSIGASIALILAARNNPRVSRVVAINPYDYAKGRGMGRSSSLARLFVALADLPILGDTVMRLRQFVIMKSVLDGGVFDPRHISPELLKEMYLVGNRRGHYRAFLNLLRNAETWETATKAYSNIKIPVLLLWGARDWSRPDEREHDRQIVPGAKMATVENGGHFLPLDRPDAVIENLLAFQAPLVGKASS